MPGHAARLTAWIVSAVASYGAAQSVSLTPEADNTIFDYPGSGVSNGAGPHFFVGKTNNTGGSSVRRGLLRFDPAAAVPPGFVIVSATLTLQCSSSNGNPTTVALHRALEDWGESISDAGSPGGAGAPAAPGDATWTHAFHATVPWSTPGGSFDPTPVATLPVVGPGTYVVGTSPSFVADLQDQLDRPWANFGWLLKTTTEFSGIAKRFDTRENVGLEPLLTLVYAPPIPATATTFGGGCAIPGGPSFTLTAAVPPVLGSANFGLSLTGGPPSGAAFIFLAGGLAPAPIALGGGCDLRLDATSLAAFVAAGVSPLGPFPLDLAGGLGLPLPIPSDPALVGFSIYGQAFAFASAAPAGFLTSGALLLVFGF